MAELSIAGWFASGAIKIVMDKAEKYLGTNVLKLKQTTREMLKTLIEKLVLCKATLEEAEKLTIDNSNLQTWMINLRLAVDDAGLVLDKMDRKNSIMENVEGKKEVSKFPFSFIFKRHLDGSLKSLKEAVDKLSKLCADIPNFINLVNMNEKSRSNKVPEPGDQPTFFSELAEIRAYMHMRKWIRETIFELVDHEETISRPQDDQLQSSKEFCIDSGARKFPETISLPEDEIQYSKQRRLDPEAKSFFPQNNHPWPTENWLKKPSSGMYPTETSMLLGGSDNPPTVETCYSFVWLPLCVYIPSIIFSYGCFFYNWFC